jgi:DNA-binding NtrC family response regulator
LNVVPIEILPLRERKEDIPYLARHFVEKLAPESGGRVTGITDAAVDKLMGYSWPGNVRELENVIERSIVMASGEKLDVEEIRLDMNLRARHAPGEVGLPEGMSLDAYEQELIRNALKQADGNKSQAARILGLTRNALRYRLTQMGIES